ncbi:hypothetical protein HDU86_000305 [Geranomyces michiganensis]|nr:hypothetical protein HDU86_000305 [Geranomyces michiganensis]
MKQRFSALDVSAQVAELRPRLVGLRMQNVYDINNKTYLFKFSRPDFKEMLLVESGIRFHSTEFARDKAHTPSHFCMKIRKHLRTRRLTAVNQLGVDRVVDLRFGEGEAAYHLILEFFASGNIILTDHEYRILALLRVVEIEGAASAAAQTTLSSFVGAAGAAAKPNEGDAKFAVGEIYDVTAARPFQPMTEEKMRSVLESAKAAASRAAAAADPAAAAEELLKEERTGGKVKGGKKKTVGSKKSAKDKNKDKENTLRKVIRDKMSQDYGPALVDHCISRSGLEVGSKVSDDLDVSQNSPIVHALLEAFREGDKIVQSCIESPQKGWIILRALDAGKNGRGPPPGTGAVNGEAVSTAFVAYDEFHPFLFQQFATNSPSGLEPRCKEFASFDKCVDEFYSKLEAQKLELRARQAEMNAVKKLESVKAGHESHVQGLHALQQESAKTAQAIEANLQLVDSIINTFRSFIASGMDWTDLEELVKDEKKKGNPVASVVTKLRLDVGMVTIQLPDADWIDSDDEDDNADETDSEADSEDESGDEETRRTKASAKPHAKPPARERTFLPIDLDIYISAFANARRYYDTKKVAAVKQDKTLQAAEKVMKAAERKIEIDLKSTQQVTPAITKMRKPYWFEKFLWFISSENYLVVGGRDAAQNELLVKRYLKKGDIYVHADLHGAASVIIKNIADPDAPPAIPPTTLHQAGTMSVCMSRAWDAKIVTSAWWVDDTQVSKTAPTGEYLTTGSFMIRGKKNWLPPVQLIYGFAILFKVDESCAARHYWERRPWRRPEGTTDGVTEEGADGAAKDATSAAYEEERSVASVHRENETETGELGTAPPQEPAEKQDSESSSNNDNAPVEAEEKAETEGNDADDATSATNVMSENTDKYAYEDDDNDQASENLHNGPSATAAAAKKRLSAKERRNIRKARAIAGMGEPDSASHKDGAEEEAQIPDPLLKGEKANRGAVQSEKVQPPPPAVRGKRGKAKKMKSKYADQDEEDMELMLSLLGSRKAQKQGPPEKLPRADGNSANNVKKHTVNITGKGKVSSASQPQSPLCDIGPEVPMSAADAGVSSGAVDHPATQVPKTNISRRGSTSDEITRLLAEENIVQLPEETDTSFLDTLTGIPHHTDVVLHAVAVCAPWSALTKYKYKAKLVPGSSKKGKAIKTLITAFCAAPPEPTRKPRREAAALMDGADVQEQTRRDDAAKRERDLIKIIPDMEMMNSLLGKVKVVLGNADLKSTSGKKSTKGG